MATKKAPKKEAPKALPKKEAMSPEEKAAKRKARQEALKNRPAGQRQNSKSLDLIPTENGGKVMNYGQPVKAGKVTLGILVTSVAYDAKGDVIGTSTTFVPGDLAIRGKKGHGNFAKAKHKKGEEDSDIEEAEDEEEEGGED